jgi:DNA-directed RNA polymerase subunit RPC12/RpoP
MIRFVCPQCGKPLKAPPTFLGRRIRCTHCRHRFRIQVSASTPTSPAEPRKNIVLDQPRPAATQRVPTVKAAAGKRSPPLAASFRSLSLLYVVLSVGALLTGIIVTFLTLSYLFPRPSETPENGSLGRFGGIEIGANGVKTVAVDFFRGKDGQAEFEPVADSRAENLASLGTLNSDGLSFNARTLAEMRGAVKGFLDQLTQKHGVKPEQVFVVVSSGVFTDFKTSDAALAGKDVLRAELRGVSSSVEFLSATDEAMYAVEASVPISERNTTLLLDFGSSSVKGGFFTDGVFTSMSLDYGTRRLLREVMKEAKKRPDVGLPELAEQLSERLVLPPLKEELDRKPSLNRRPRVLLVGGIVWAMATCTRPAEVGQKTVDLSPGDLGRFRALVRESWGTQGTNSSAKDRAAQERALRERILAPIAEPEIRGRAAKEIERVQELFAPDQLVVGAELLRTVAAEYDFDHKQIVFRNAPVARVVGYLMKKSGAVP